MKRIGVIGIGTRIKKVIGNTLFNATNNAKVVAITDISEEKINKSLTVYLSAHVVIFIPDLP